MVNIIRPGVVNLNRRKVVSLTGASTSYAITGGPQASKNGYLFVYLSNASSQPVYFDDFFVSHQRSQLIEEDHYYAHGLKITAISSKAVASSLNPKAVSYGYQGSFSEEVSEFELNYNEFALRTYDPQIGRWATPDPYDEFPSPYTGMGNDPANNVDPSGGNIFSAIWSFLGGSGSAASGALAQVACPGATAAVNATASGVTTAIRIATVSIAVGGSAINHVMVDAINSNLNAVGGANLGAGSGLPGSGGPNGNGYVDPTGQINQQLNEGLTFDEGSQKNDDDWKPLSKDILYDYYKKNNPNTPENSLHQRVGYYYEDVWDFYGSVNLDEFKYEANPIIRGDQTLKPDGRSSSVSITFIRRKKKVYPNGAFYEVKAKSRGIYRNEDAAQLIEYAYELARSNPQAVLGHAAKLIVMTTSNMTIPSDVMQNIEFLGVQLVHLVGYYKVSSEGKMRFDFYQRFLEGTTEGDRPYILNKKTVIVNFR